MSPAATRLIAALRTGAWLTAERARFIAAVVAILGVLALAALVVTASGSIDIWNRPLGTDFSSFYSAGRLVLDGHASAPFVPELQFAREQALFGVDTQFYAWQYPPFFLLVAAPLAVLPYPLALALWQGVTLALYLLVIRAILRRFAPEALGFGRPPLWLLLAFGFPAVFLTLGHGQNAFLSAALLGGGLLLLERRPIVAGVLFGLLAYKPQLGVLIPVALVAGGRWRAVAAAIATVVLLAGIATLAFGADVWTAFGHSMAFTRTNLLEAGGPGWPKLQTPFALVRLWGGPLELAYAVQAGCTLAAAAVVALLWRGRAAFPVKAGALAIATVIATPFSLDYDMMVLAPAMAFLAAEGLARGFMPYEKTALAAMWLAPLVARNVAAATRIPLGTLAVLAAFALMARRLDFDRQRSHAGLRSGA